MQSLIHAGSNLSLTDDCLMTALDVVGEKLIANIKTEAERDKIKLDVRER